MTPFFPPRNYESIFMIGRDVWGNKTNKRWFYRYAHNDIVQFMAEYGIIGTALVFGGIVALLLQAVCNRGDHLLAVLMLLAGASLAFAHAFLDFIFSSPAYWIGFIGLLVIATKLLELDAARQS